MRDFSTCCKNANGKGCAICNDAPVCIAGVARKLTNVRIGEYDFDTCQIFPGWTNLTFVQVNGLRAFSLGARVFGSGHTQLGHPRAEP